MTDFNELALAHHGVKGMKWGVHKKEALPMHRNFGQKRQGEVAQDFGKKAVGRVNARMHDGKTFKQSVRREFMRSLSQQMAISGAVTALAIMDLHGKGMSGIAKRAETKRGQAILADQFGLPSKPTNGPTFAKKSRSGVHTITSI